MPALQDFRKEIEVCEGQHEKNLKLKSSVYNELIAKLKQSVDTVNNIKRFVTRLTDPYSPITRE